MSVRDVLVRFRATVDGFTTPVDKATASVEQLRASTEKMQAWDKVSTGALAAGAAITAGLGFAVKAAMDWETAWTGVLKTVDASPAQFSVLEDQLKELARTLPASATEIAAVAENAGQLGIRADDIGRFTKTMINLGEATNLTADEASTAIAQIANIMGTTGEDIDRFGAALVALGNNGASTERDIVQMAQRIAASGKLVGLNETDILAYASALSSVGIEAEAGGTAISTSFTQIGNAVDQGGQKLTTIAHTAGLTSAQFKKAFDEDAAGAMAKFVTGLNAVEEQGGSASRVLDDLGMSGIRQKNALLSLATSGDLLANSLKISSQAWSENTALVNEAARRYETTESRMKMAQNTATQAAASIGEQLLPVLASMADGAAKAAEAFGNLPTPIKSIIAYSAAFAGTGLLALGSVMKLVKGLADLKGGLSTLGDAFPKLSARMAGVNWTRVAAGAGVAMAALTTLLAVARAWSEEAAKITLTSEGVADGLAAIGKGGVGIAPLELELQKLQQAFAKIGSSTSGIENVGEFLKSAARNTSDWQQQVDLAITGFLGLKDSVQLVSDEADKLDQGLNSLATSGNTEEAQRAFRELRDQAALTGTGVAELAPVFDTYGQTLQQTAAQLGITTLSAEELGRWMAGEVPASVRAAAAAHPELVTALTDAQQAMVGEKAASDDVSAALQKQAEQTRDAAQAQVQASGSMVSWHETLAAAKKALDDVTVSVNKSHTEINLNTKAGRANQTTLDQLAGSALNTATAMEKSGASTEDVAKVMKRSRSAFVEAATKMGLTKTAANELADAYGLIPDVKKTGVEEKGSKDAKKNVNNLENAIDSLPEKTQTTVSEKGSKTAKSNIDSVWNALNRIDGQVATTYIKTKKVDEGASTPGTLHRASGGWVFGPGSWTSDSILTALSRDEFVVRAARATMIEKAYPGFLSYLNGSAPLGGGHADGGSPTVATYAAAPAFAPQVLVQVPEQDTRPVLQIGTLLFEPDNAEELRTLREFMAMASRKAAAGL